MNNLNIDPLLEYVSDLTPKELDILHDPLISHVMEDYIISNFNTLSEGNVQQNWTLIANKLMDATIKLSNIQKTYGKVIMDLYVSKVKEIYNVPDDKVEFDIDDKEMEVESSKIDMDDVEEEEDFNDVFRTELNHAHIKNALVNGGALYNWELLFDEIKDDLDALDDVIYPTIKEFIVLAQLLQFSQFPVRGVEEAVAGTEQLDFSDDKKIKIKVKGMNFVIACHEVLKGVYDIYNEHSFPRDLPAYGQKYVRKISSDLYFEKWAWLYGRIFFKVHVDSKYNNEEPYYKYLYSIFKKPYNELLDFLMEI